jgi:hypothetical protein
MVLSLQTKVSFRKTIELTGGSRSRRTISSDRNNYAVGYEPGLDDAMWMMSPVGIGQQSKTSAKFLCPFGSTLNLRWTEATAFSRF